MATLSNKQSPDKVAKSIQNRGNIEQSLYFPTRVNHIDVPGYESLNKQLVKDIYNWKKEGGSNDRSNSVRAGSWHSEVNMHQRQEQSFQQLYQLIQKSCVALIEKFVLQPIPFIIDCNTMWANINPKGGFNKSHTHPGAIFSGVYYVQAPEDCGQLVLEDPVVTRQFSDVIAALKPDNTFLKERNLKFYDLIKPEDYTRVTYDAVPGRLIFFPSYLSHHVEPNLNKKDRISVSFNINVLKDMRRLETDTPNFESWKQAGSNQSIVRTSKKQYKFNPGFTKSRQPLQPVQQNQKTQINQPKIWKLPGT